MRDFLIFLAVVAAIFFGVGEWRGWYLGVPSQTPMFVYQKDYVAEASRRTINRDELPVKLVGRVRQGRVTVAVVYEDVGSFQAGRAAGGSEVVFEETYREGQLIALNESFEEGRGIYRVRLDFDDATGVFRLELPKAAEL